VPAGRVSSNSMMLSLVSTAEELQGKRTAGRRRVEMLPAARGYDKPFVAVMLVSFPA